MTKPIERVLLALDAAADTRTAIDIAVRLAAHAKVRLHAVFVEDEDLLTLASLPVAREVVAGAGAGGLTPKDVELHLRAAASRAQEDIRDAARPHALEHSFEIVRGAADTALAIVSEGDLVVAAAVARPVAGHFRVESRWHQALELTPGPVLLARQGANKCSRVVVLLRERSASSARMLHAAARIAELGGGTLTVICPPEFAATQDFAKWVEDQIAPAGIKPEIEAAAGGLPAVEAHIAELGCGLLAVDASAAGHGELSEIAQRLACDVLVAN